MQSVDGYAHGAKLLFVYSDLDNVHFVNNYKHHHHVTERITYRNMGEIPQTAKGENATVLRAIPTEVI